jgi:hypothetical protein
MELSSLTLRVLLLFFPGVLCALLVDALTVHRERTPAQFLTNAFALGMASYLSLALVRDVVAAFSGWLRLSEPLDITFFDALVNDGVKIAWGEITLAAAVALILAGAISAMTNHNVIFRFARRLGISRKTGEIDVWGLLFASDLGDRVIVRDPAHDLAYRGSVEAFSESSERAELLLSDVVVYRHTTATKLYETDRLYLARNVNELVIEAIDVDNQPRA